MENNDRLFYCSQNNGDCETCSLSNYWRDCQNNRIYKIRSYEEIEEEIGDNHGLFTLD